MGIIDVFSKKKDNVAIDNPIAGIQPPFTDDDFGLFKRGKNKMNKMKRKKTSKVEEPKKVMDEVPKPPEPVTEKEPEKLEIPIHGYYNQTLHLLLIKLTEIGEGLNDLNLVIEGMAEFESKLNETNEILKQIRDG